MEGWRELEVTVSMNGYEVEAVIDAPTGLDKQDLFRYILDLVELDYDDSWVES